MVNKSKNLGTSHETAIVNYLRERGVDAERLALAGGEDQGDVIVKEPWGHTLIEAKNTAKYDLPEFVKQATDERNHYAKARGIDPKTILPIVVIKRRGKGIKDAFVVTSLEEFFPEADK